MLLLSWVIEYSWQENTTFGEWFLDPTVKELEMYFTKYDVKRLELYAQNMVDYHLIVDLLPSISRLYFLNQMDVQLSIVQSVSFISKSDILTLKDMPSSALDTECKLYLIFRLTNSARDIQLSNKL